jgi:hypothetical protein
MISNNLLQHVHPHLHGDPFSHQTSYKCLYGPSNYSSFTSHPPVIGFSFDGHLIYGRYLSASSPGFAAPLLDACGDHKHTNPQDVDEHGFNLASNYHYHTQVFETTCKSGEMCQSGEKYKLSTTGPFKCWKTDLSAQEGSSATMATGNTAKKSKADMEYRCCGMTDYYLLTGISLPSTDITASSSCTVPAAAANGAYVDSVCSTADAMMLSGHQCTLKCNAGFCPNSSTKCVKGSLVETATCVLCAGQNHTNHKSCVTVCILLVCAVSLTTAAGPV